MLISELSFLLLLLKFSFKIQVVVTLVFDISIYDVWIAFFFLFWMRRRTIKFWIGRVIVCWNGKNADRCRRFRITSVDRKHGEHKLLTFHVVRLTANASFWLHNYLFNCLSHVKLDRAAVLRICAWMYRILRIFGFRIRTFDPCFLQFDTKLWKLVVISMESFISTVIWKSLVTIKNEVSILLDATD